MDTHVVILAAGKGTRMKSARPKVLHRVAGQTLVEHVLACAAAIRPQTTTVVIGHQADTLTAALAGYPGLTFVVQEPQLGTAHALMTTERTLSGKHGLVVLLSGDVPMLTAKTLKNVEIRSLYDFVKNEELDQDWDHFILGIFINKEVPKGFPLKRAPEDIQPEIFLTDSERSLKK